MRELAQQQQMTHKLAGTFLHLLFRSSQTRRLLLLVTTWHECALLEASRQREVLLESSYSESLHQKEALCDSLLQREAVQRDAEAVAVREAEMQTLREAEFRAVAVRERDASERDLREMAQRTQELEAQLQCCTTELQQAHLTLGEKELILRSSLGWEEALELNAEPIGVPALAMRVRSLPHHGVGALMVTLALMRDGTGKH